jgi:Ser/Thr protein kinase RdoA (MazF antagonist)
MLNKLIIENYGMEAKSILLIDSHFGTEIFLAETDRGKFVVKTLPLYVKGMENEGRITNYLYNNGINVAQLLKTNNGQYHVKTSEIQFHVQEFIEGKTLSVNTAPVWFLQKSAHILGKIHNILKNYRNLDTSFGEDFFKKSNVMKTINYYTQLLAKASDENNTSLIPDLEERLRHLERIALFDIQANKLTYSNSHGDFNIGQIITNNEDITVIDWTSASKLPVCLEVIVSYTTEDPSCMNGKIDINGLRKYIQDYSRYFTLNDYDIQIMPYILYFQQLMCHYEPPYSNVADTYKPICNLINNFTKWLYENVEILSNELCKI